MINAKQVLEYILFGVQMGQRDVLLILKDLRKVSSVFYSTEQIREEMKERGFSNGTIQGLANDVMILATWRQIEYRGVGTWQHKKEFRAYKD